ncbi:tRNA-specific adenosine deaminase 1 [Bombyx mandarina]|uniref:tRNA-specific adenosine deaminase 1 n=1 Tax=Bombyx mandarina TaxID=7092 RepID=A0A6J2JBL9_BOMMA|nr:tRNA-specific adenosine deaminase 1 [Bombyx mandarina]
MPDNLSSVCVDTIVEKCLKTYEQLPKKGKPADDEWTVLSCIVKYETEHDTIEVLSLGTGSKCIGATKMSPLGDLLNDSHAEVFARRGLIHYLFQNIEKATNNLDSIFIKTDGKLKLKDSIEFIFYSSQLPCGDASIIPKNGEEKEDHFGDLIKVKRKADDSDCVHDTKKLKLSDIHRTGAKCLSNAEQDLKIPGKDYHVLGQVRTKPGRGDRTLSVSCSDKIARWVHLGIHGALLDLICEPVCIKHFIFGASVPYCEESLNRAILKRSNEFNNTRAPKFYQSSITFSDIKSEGKYRPAPGSIVWINLTNPILEVAVQGRKLGLTKKGKSISPDASLIISKYNIYKTFLKLLNRNKELKVSIFGNESIENIPYNKMKIKSKQYRDRWENLKEKFFRIWTVKADMWDFCVKIL